LRCCSCCRRSSSRSPASLGRAPLWVAVLLLVVVGLLQSLPIR
jgi:hypothetical protein